MTEGDYALLEVFCIGLDCVCYTSSMLLWSTNAYEIESSVRISLHGPLQMISTKRLSNKKNYNGRSSVDLLLVYTKILQNNSPL